MENENIQQTPSQPTSTPFQIQEATPNSTAVLVLGIVSIVTCFCYGVVGIVTGIIALVMASKGLAMYAMTPEKYSLNSLNNLKAGKICAIVGLCLSALYLVFVIIYLAVIGVAVCTMPWEMCQ